MSPLYYVDFIGGDAPIVLFGFPLSLLLPLLADGGAAPPPPLRPDVGGGDDGMVFPIMCFVFS